MTSLGLLDSTLSSLVASTVLLGLLGILDRSGVLGSPRTRARAWTLAMIALPFLPWLRGAVPVWELPWSSPWSSAPCVSPRAAEAAHPFAPIEFGVPDTGTAIDLVPAAVREPAASGSGRGEADAFDRSVTLLAHWPSRDTALLALWITIGGISLLRLLGHLRGLSRLRRFAARTEPVRHRAWRTELEDLRVRLGIRRPVALVHALHVQTPSTFGVWRPVIVLPYAALCFPAGRRRAVLLHELAHVRSLDWWQLEIAAAISAVFWFHPLIHGARRRMRAAVELACDEVVVAEGARPSAYAAFLLDLTRRFVGAEAGRAPTLPHSPPGLLELRERVAHLVNPMDSPRSWKDGLKTTLLAAALVAMGTARFPARASTGPAADDPPTSSRSATRTSKVLEALEKHRARNSVFRSPIAQRPSRKDVATRDAATKDVETKVLETTDPAEARRFLQDLGVSDLLASLPRGEPRSLEDGRILNDAEREKLSALLAEHPCAGLRAEDVEAKIGEVLTELGFGSGSSPLVSAQFQVIELGRAEEGGARSGTSPGRRSAEPVRRPMHGETTLHLRQGSDRESYVKATFNFHHGTRDDVELTRNRWDLEYARASNGARVLRLHQRKEDHSVITDLGECSLAEAHAAKPEYGSVVRDLVPKVGHCYSLHVSTRDRDEQFAFRVTDVDDEAATISFEWKVLEASTLPSDPGTP